MPFACGGPPHAFIFEIVSDTPEASIQNSFRLWQATYVVESFSLMLAINLIILLKIVKVF